MNEVTVPPAIKTALESRHGYVLAITGAPGTGKSLFVQTLFKMYPKAFLVIGSTEALVAAESNLRDCVDWTKRHRSVRSLDGSSAPSSLLQSIDADPITLLGGECKEIHEADVIIVDAWPQLLELFEESHRRVFEKSIIHAVHDTKKKLILVCDRVHHNPALMSLLHDADGIIRLEKKRVENRIYRQLIIDKMRSLSVVQDTFLFTLDGGRCTYIPWYKHRYPPITVEREPIPDPTPTKISTGNRSLDALLEGGFSRGSHNLLEVEDLALSYLETIYVPFLSNQLQLGRPAIIVLPEGWSPDKLIRSLTHFVDNNVITQRVVFFGRNVPSYSNVRPLSQDPVKTLQEIRYEAGQLERKYGMETTELFALDTLENRYGDASLKSIVAEICTAIAATDRVTVSIVSTHQSVRAESIPHDVHLRVLELCGVISVCGVNPRTNFLAVRPILSGGFLDYELIPIV